MWTFQFFDRKQKLGNNDLIFCIKDQNKSKHCMKTCIFWRNFRGNQFFPFNKATSNVVTETKSDVALAIFGPTAWCHIRRHLPHFKNNKVPK